MFFLFYYIHVSLVYHSILVSEVCNRFLFWTKHLLIPLRIEHGGLGVKRGAQGKLAHNSMTFYFMYIFCLLDMKIQNIN